MNTIYSSDRDPRTTLNNINREANSTKKALSKIYTADHSRKNSKKSIGANRVKRSGSSCGSVKNVIIVPKFAGCSPGGINSSFQVRFKKDQNNSQQKPSRNFSKTNSAVDIGIDPLRVNDLRKNDKCLKR